MKLRIMNCLILLALFAVPALADTISFTNQGALSGSQLGGISAVSGVNSLSVNGNLISNGPLGSVQFSTGLLTGNLSQGSFTGGEFGFSIGGGAVIFVNNFVGTLTRVGDDLYDLIGSFSGSYDGIHFTGSTNQLFSFDDGHDGHCFKDISGTTTLNATVVPEPGTLLLFGTGLIGLAGAVRRKLAAGRA